MIDSSPQHGPIEVSKSQRKREAQAWLNLAKKLISMPDHTRQRLPLDTDLRAAVDFARNIRQHGAYKRQLQTIGKMLRNRDATALADAVASLDQQRRQLSARHHLAEAWRDRLIMAGDDDLAELLQHCTGLKAQTLRQLIRSAGKQAQAGKPPTAARKLFKLLRAADEHTPLPPLPAN